MMTTFSYSRINLFSQCPRKFYLKYILGQEEPPNTEAELGKAVHRYIELTLKDEPNPMPIVLQEAALPLKEKEVKKFATHYLKKHVNSPVQRYEGHLVQPIGQRGCELQGYIDILDEAGIIPLVTDIKTGRVIYDPNDTMQLRIYAWLLHKAYGYEVVRARLWFTRLAYKDAVKEVEYTLEDFQAAEEWANEKIDEIYTRMISVQMGLEEPIEAFPPEHGHLCTSCPYAAECRPDLLVLPEITDHVVAQEVAGKLLTLERAIDLAKANLRAYSVDNGPVQVGDEVWDFRQQENWFFPVDTAAEILRAQHQDPYHFLKVDSKKLLELMNEDPNVGEPLREISTVKPQKTFVHKKAGKADEAIEGDESA